MIESSTPPSAMPRPIDGSGLPDPSSFSSFAVSPQQRTARKRMQPPQSPAVNPIPVNSPAVKPMTPPSAPSTSGSVGVPGMPGGPTQPAYSPPDAQGQGHVIPTTPPVQTFPTNIPGLPGGPTEPYYSPPDANGQGHAIPAPSMPLQESPATNPNTPPSAASIGGGVSLSPIDPANDLRGQAVLPTASAALTSAQQGFADATGALSSFDRLAALRDALSQFGVSAPAVNAGPSEQGSLDTLNGLVSTATNKVAGANRANDVQRLRDDLTKYFGNTDVTAGPNISTDPSARLSSYNGLLDDAASKLAGVDRVQMAKDLLAQFDEAQLPEHELALRKLTDQYVARGGGRSGQLLTAYGDEDLARQRDRDLFVKGILSDALNGSIQDQFDKANALAGLQSSVFGQDQGVRNEQRADRGYQTDVATGNVNRGLSTREAAQSAASDQADRNLSADSNALSMLAGLQSAMSGREAARRDEQRTERNTQAALDQGNRDFASTVASGSANDLASRLAAANNLFSTLSQTEANNRAEVRGERTNQSALEQQAFEREVLQQQMEQQAQQQQLQRALALLSAGEAGNPSNVLSALSAGGGLDADLITQLAQSLGRGPVQTGTTGTIPNIPIPAGIPLPSTPGVLS